jgi:hypothetical protein
MNQFRIRESGQVVTEQEYRDMHPNVSFPAVLVPDDADAVLQSPAPSVAAFQTAARNGVVQDALGNWVYAWTVRDWAQEEIDAFLASSKAALIKQIDADVDAIYRAAVGERGPEYDAAEAQATAFKAAVYAGTVPTSVQSWATAKGWTAQQAADDILAAAAQLNGARDALRAARLLRKEQARVATTAAGLDTVRVQWTSFVTSIRAALGITN